MIIFSSHLCAVMRVSNFKSAKHLVAPDEQMCMAAHIGSVGQKYVNIFSQIAFSIYQTFLIGNLTISFNKKLEKYKNFSLTRSSRSLNWGETPSLGVRWF